MKHRFAAADVRQARSATAHWVLGAEGVRWHLRLLAAAAVALVLANVAADPARLWSLPAIGVWAVVVAVHAGLASPALRWLAGSEPVPAVVGATVAGWTSRRPAAMLGLATGKARGEAERTERPDPAPRRAEPAMRPVAEQPAAAPGQPAHWSTVTVAPAPAAVSGHRRHQDPRPTPTQPDGTLPEAVAALWGVPVPAAAPTIVEHFAGWRWSSPPPAPPATFTAQPTRSATDGAASRSDAEAPVPLSVLATEPSPESSLAGD